MEINRIAICGVPKSGTKLLNHMIHTALPSWDYSPDERNCMDYLNKKKIITKKPLDLFRFNKFNSRKDTIAIITCRDPLLVLTSKHRTSDYWVYADRFGKGQPAPFKWYDQIIKWRDKGAFVVYYENLVDNPDLIQKQMELRFNIKFVKNFSEYINVPIGPSYEYLNVVRPLQMRQLKVEDLPHLGTQLNKSPKLIQQRKELGYENISLLQ
jgi:hypothetical protein